MADGGVLAPPFSFSKRKDPAGVMTRRAFLPSLPRKAQNSDPPKQGKSSFSLQFWDNFYARDQANRDYLDAQERGASQEEIDRLKAKYDELAKEQSQILDDRRTVRVELEAARETAPTPAEPKQQTVEQPVQQQSGGETTVTTQEPQQTQPAQQGPQQLTREEATQAWNDAKQKTEDARANAEKAANDYLLALKSGDKYTIDAFKEELQKANDALLAAKKDEDAALANVAKADAAALNPKK